MKQTIEKTFGDICKKEVECKRVKVPVIFHTEQTEGRAVKPYFSEVTIDICKECAEKAFRLHANGAQGYNSYWIEEQDK